jgi:hypothetical protein
MHSREYILTGMHFLECIPKIKDPNTSLVHLTKKLMALPLLLFYFIIIIFFIRALPLLYRVHCNINLSDRTMLNFLLILVLLSFFLQSLNNLEMQKYILIHC